MSFLKTGRQIRGYTSFDICTMREVLDNFVDGSADFEVSGYRFIKENEIDEIHQKELGDDLYILGCFDSNFLASILGINEAVITKLQEIDGYEEIGSLVISLGKLKELQKEAVKWDGYGHFFNSYDGNYDEISDYLVFRIN